MAFYNEILFKFEQLYGLCKVGHWDAIYKKS